MTNKSASLEMTNGVFFDVLNPDPAKIKIETIAHALAHLNRFGGFCRRGFSVAEHSVHASDNVDTSKCETALEAILLRLQALLHDATEGVCLIDIPTPVKKLWLGWSDMKKKLLPGQVADLDDLFYEMKNYYEIEAGLARCVGGVFGVELEKLSQQTKDIDAILCLTEKMAFIGPLGLDHPDWAPLSSRYKPHRHSFLPRWLDRALNKTAKEVGGIAHWVPTADLEPTVFYHVFMPPWRAKRRFLARFKELRRALNEVSYEVEPK